MMAYKKHQVPIPRIPRFVGGLAVRASELPRFVGLFILKPLYNPNREKGLSAIGARRIMEDCG